MIQPNEILPLKRSKRFSLLTFSLILLLVVSLLPFYYYLTRAVES